MRLTATYLYSFQKSFKAKNVVYTVLAEGTMCTTLCGGWENLPATAER